MIDAKILEAAWAAFPSGACSIVGTKSIGGQSVLRDKNGHAVWFFPDTGKIARPGMEMFEEAKEAMSLLPDHTDRASWILLKVTLADRMGMDGSNGAFWTPKNKMIRDARGGQSKVIEGWSMKSLTSTTTLPITVTNQYIALFNAIALTNCQCGTEKRKCPQHGESRFKPWR